MAHTSMRDFLKAAGKAASVRQVATASRWPFPLSLRRFTGALPPGRIQRKVVSLDLLQRKFDEFLNRRGRPPFLIRFHGTRFGASTVTVTFDDPARGFGHEPFASIELAGPGEVLEFPGIIFGTHRFHFRDLNSDGITIDLISRRPILIEVSIRFETSGAVEINAEDFPNID
jgi:hypothetical protein